MRTSIPGIFPGNVCLELPLSAQSFPGNQTRPIHTPGSIPAHNAREITGRLLLDATIPYDWKDKPIPIELDPEMVERESRDAGRNWALDKIVC